MKSFCKWTYLEGNDGEWTIVNWSASEFLFLLSGPSGKHHHNQQIVDQFVAMNHLDLMIKSPLVMYELKFHLVAILNGQFCVLCNQPVSGTRKNLEWFF